MEVYSNDRRQGSYFDSKRSSPPRTPLARTTSNERSPTETNGSPKLVPRKSSLGSDNGQPSPPPLVRATSSETAQQHFPLNDIDYESSPAAVAQELSNLQAIRRMSMNVDVADPDLPAFSPSFAGVPTRAPAHGADEDDPSRLFWVPARLHPELAPTEFKTFIEDRVDRVRRRSGGSEDTLSPDGIERQGSGSSLRRKKSMLSRQIDTSKPGYEDGAERLERKRSQGEHLQPHPGVTNLSELETLVNDPSTLISRVSIDTARRSQDSGVEVPASQDMPILPPSGQSLKRSTRTTYRRGSLRKGERVPFSKRAMGRHADADTEDSPVSSPIVPGDDASLGLTRVQTEPTPPPSESAAENFSRPSARRRPGLGASQSSDNLVADGRPSLERRSPTPEEEPKEEPKRPQPQPVRQFHSRIATAPGRTTAQLPGYNNTNPIPAIVETLPDGSRVPLGGFAPPERRSSHAPPPSKHPAGPLPRGPQSMRPGLGRSPSKPNNAAHSSTLDDISSNPSPLPGSGSTRTDALTMVPTFEDKKSDKKDGSRKPSWGWLLGNEEKEKEKRLKEERAQDEKAAQKAKALKLSKAPDKTRLDLLQTSIEGGASPRGRESLVIDRDSIRLDDERKKDGGKKGEKKDKESGILSAIFGGGKRSKASEDSSREKKRASNRGLSPEPPPRILKADIDYNWTRFSILEERAIYRMAHIKLANPRRALYSQVLLSNFMYSYLAKVQMMHPQIQIPAAQKAAQQRLGGAKKDDNKPEEFSQYQKWQQVGHA